MGKYISADESMIGSRMNFLRDFASEGHLLKAFQVFCLIQYHGSHHVISLLQCISSLLSSCVNLKSLPNGKQLHGLIISMGFEQHPVLLPKLVTLYSNFNIIVDSHTITENLNFLHPLPWNILISSYVINGLYGGTLSVYKKMKSKGIRPDNFTYSSILMACGEKLDLAFGREVHESINTTSHVWSLFVLNSLVFMYAKTDELDIAHCLFYKMAERDVVSWNTMISAYASKGMWKEAFDLFEKMRVEGVESNIITWNTMAGGSLQLGKFRSRSLELLAEMRSCGIHLDSVAMLIGLCECFHWGH